MVLAVIFSKHAVAGITIVDIEQAPSTYFHHVGISKDSPTRETKIGSTCLVGDYNLKIFRLVELDEGDLKCPHLMNASPGMF